MDPTHLISEDKPHLGLDIVIINSEPLRRHEMSVVLEHVLLLFKFAV